MVKLNQLFECQTNKIWRVVQEFVQRFGESNYPLLYELQSQVDWKIFPGRRKQ